jgi:hypothetical protein
MSSRTALTTRGQTIATLLAGSWRSTVAPAGLNDGELAEITSFLLRSGAGPLAWRRIASTPLAETVAAHELRHASLLHLMQAEVHRTNLLQLLEFLAERGLDLLLIKGWSVSRLYPNPKLRPYGDFDLVFPPGQLAEVLPEFSALGNACGEIDLHDGLPDLADHPWSEVWARSQLVEFGERTIRVPGPEDQLRQQCLHLLRHGAWRPLWLCDIGAILESAGPDFDVDYFLSGRQTASAWVRAAIALASLLLDVRASRFGGEPPPAWLTEAVLEQWGRGICGDSHNRDGTPLLEQLLRPRSWRRALRSRWPNAIEASLQMRQSPHSRVPRLFVQGAVVACRAGSLIQRLPRKFAATKTARGLTIHAASE